MDQGNAAQSSRQCQWCDVVVGADIKHCPTCGAALVLRETIGDLVVPGVTHVDPGLSQYAAQPLHIPGASPSHSVAGSAVGAAVVAGGPVGLLALGGLAAVAATEYMTAGAGIAQRQAALDRVGQPSEAVLRMLERLELEENGTATGPSETAEEHSSQTG